MENSRVKKLAFIMDKEYRILAILQIFTIILVFKGISATYLATQYSMKNQLWIIEEYSSLTKIIPLFLLIPLILFTIPLIFNLSRKSRKVLDTIALILFTLGIISLIIL